MTKTIIAGLALVCFSAFAHAQNLSPEEINNRQIQRRAVEAVIWGMPAVNYDLMLQEALKTGAKENEIVYWGEP
jgi:hypothetical protein